MKVESKRLIGRGVRLSALPYASMPALLEAMCRRYANQTAYQCMGASLTYSDLALYAKYLATFFQSYWGLRKGDKIGIQLPNVLAYPVLLLAAWRAGLVIVNTNPLYTRRESTEQFMDAEVSALVLFETLAHHASYFQVVLPALKRRLLVIRLGDMSRPLRAFALNWGLRYAHRRVKPYKRASVTYLGRALRLGRSFRAKSLEIPKDMPALLQYTGGTSGVLKAAVLTHAHLMANLEQVKAYIANYVSDGKECFITALPLYHIYAFTCGGLLSMRLGACNVLVIDPRNMKALLKTLNRHAFTIFLGVNTLFARLLQSRQFPTRHFSKTPLVFSSGMALSPPVAERWKKKTGRAIIEAYGLSEASPGVSANPPNEHAKIGSVGLPLADTSIKIVNERMELCDPNKPGEILIKGPQVMCGYWRRDKENKQAFVDGYFRTGDVGYLDEDGYLWIVDRKKEVLNVSGFNVYPSEVERVLAGCAGVAEVGVAIAKVDDAEAVKAYIVKEWPSLTQEAVHAHARAQLTPYKRPKSIAFVNELPKSHVGKLLRRLLPHTDGHKLK